MRAPAVLSCHSKDTMKKLFLLLIVTQLSAQSVLLYQSPVISMSAPAAATAAKSELNQIGEQNTAEVNLLGGTLQLQQIGDRNQLRLNESNSYLQSGTGVEIYGSNNQVDIMGNNSISEKMTLRITGDYRTVVIKNY